MDLGSLWGLLTIVGPIVLIVALVYAISRNRTTKAQDARTEAATAANYDRQSAEDNLRDGT